MVAINSAAEPRSSNHGAKESSHRQRQAVVDWLAFTLRVPEGRSYPEGTGPGKGGDALDPNYEEWLRRSLNEVFGLGTAEWCPAGHGDRGYSSVVYLGDHGEYGRVAFGGVNQRRTVYVSFTGKACMRFADLQIVRSWCESNDVTIKRLDLAYDDFRGEEINIEVVTSWYNEGAFTCGGRPPKVRFIDDFGTGEGRTFYVGRRGNGKFFRAYEKGHQLGDKNDPWFRVEVEFTATSRVIPLEALTHGLRYLAGAYPCLEYLSQHQNRIRTTQRTATITYKRMVDWLKSAGGKAIHTMLAVEGGDAFGVVNQVSRPGTPRRLRGLVDHIPLVAGAVP